MSSASQVPALRAQAPSLFARVLALIAPQTFADPLVQARLAAELARNPSLEVGPGRAEVMAVIRSTTIQRLHRVRWSVIVASLSTGSALLVAYFLRTTAITPMLPHPVLAVGSVFSLAAAMAAYLRRRRRSGEPKLPVRSTGPRLVDVLYWIGVCWGALALL